MVIVGQQNLTLDDYRDILFGGKSVEIHAGALERVEKSFDFLNDFSREKVVYGINTGLGPMAQYHISEEDRKQLQYNAIRSHAAGAGERIPDIYVKAAMITSLNSYLKGHSGIHPEVVVLLKELINRNIIPLVPEHGGVGASGDLVQLAHIALVIIGEGEVSYKNQILPTQRVFNENGLKPASVHIREGLSLINGTYVMTGTGIVNLVHAKNLVEWSIRASSLTNEIVGSFDDYFSAELNSIKKHPGQVLVAEKMRTWLEGSKLIKSRKDHAFNKNEEDIYIEEKVQEYYSLRCVPQVVGAILDTVEYAEKTLLDEANSCSDNPVMDIEHRNILHGGNFHGDYVSFEMDKLKTAVTKLSMLAERQLNYLLNSRLNDILPPFVNMGKLGVNFGMQGAQFTATSTVAENQTLSFPMYVHSISCNNDNQDIVSMGTNAALITKKVIENAYQVLSIELIGIIQAIDCISGSESLSPATRSVYKKLREIVPAFSEDSIKYTDIRAVRDYLSSAETLKQLK